LVAEKNFYNINNFDKQLEMKISVKIAEKHIQNKKIFDVRKTYRNSYCLP